jgi:hypothetical protein
VKQIPIVERLERSLELFEKRMERAQHGYVTVAVGDLRRVTEAARAFLRRCVI